MRHIQNLERRQGTKDWGSCQQVLLQMQGFQVVQFNYSIQICTKRKQSKKSRTVYEKRHVNSPVWQVHNLIHPFAQAPLKSTAQILHSRGDSRKCRKYAIQALSSKLQLFTSTCNDDAEHVKSKLTCFSLILPLFHSVAEHKNVFSRSTMKKIYTYNFY